MSNASPHGKHSARGGTAQGDGLHREFPKSQLAHSLAGESTLVFTCSVSLFICRAQHRSGRLKERRGDVESPARLAVSLCQERRGLASLLPSSWHLAEILKKKPTHPNGEATFDPWRGSQGSIRSGAPSLGAGRGSPARARVGARSRRGGSWQAGRVFLRPLPRKSPEKLSPLWFQSLNERLLQAAGSKAGSAQVKSQQAAARHKHRPPQIPHQLHLSS